MHGIKKLSKVKKKISTCLTVQKVKASRQIKEDIPSKLTNAWHKKEAGQSLLALLYLNNIFAIIFFL